MLALLPLREFSLRLTGNPAGQIFGFSSMLCNQLGCVYFARGGGGRGPRGGKYPGNPHLSCFAVRFREKHIGDTDSYFDCSQHAHLFYELKKAVDFFRLADL